MLQNLRSDRTLLIFPPLAAQRLTNGALGFPRKFVDGIREWARLWHGPVILAVKETQAADDNPDRVAVLPGELPFGIEAMPESEHALIARLRRAGLVFATLVPAYVTLAESCALAHVPLVYDADYPLSVRRGIVRAQVRNPLLRWRREWWVTRMEARYRAAVQRADGIQCQGAPAFESYGGINRCPLLYFDTRVRREMLATPEQMQARIARLLDRRPLRLVFSGRLVAMKGADHLPRVAAELRRLGTKFVLDVFGSGELEPQLRRSIQQNGLNDCVCLHGEVPFPELANFVAQESDLLVCCHRQGDPSATFLETMSGGVPIAGYEGEGLRGILQYSHAGWLSPMNEPKLLAKLIAELDQNRTALVERALAALEFAKQHTFEKTMRERVDHLLQCSRNANP